MPDIVKTLNEFGITPLIHDPFANKDETQHEYQLDLSDISSFTDLDALIIAVPHTYYLQDIGQTGISSMLKKDAVIFDIKSLFRDENFNLYTYASL